MQTLSYIYFVSWSLFVLILSVLFGWVVFWLTDLFINIKVQEHHTGPNVYAVWVTKASVQIYEARICRIQYSLQIVRTLTDQQGCSKNHERQHIDDMVKSKHGNQSLYAPSNQLNPIRFILVSLLFKIVI